MKTLSLLVPLLFFTPAHALLFYVNHRPVKLKLPFVQVVEVFDPGRDYDREVIDHGLTLFERCATAALTEPSPVVTAPDWQALLGLSLHLQRFDHARSQLQSASAADLAWTEDHVARQRAGLKFETSFLELFVAASQTRVAHPIDLLTLARTSILNLRGGEARDEIRWLTDRLATLPNHVLRPPGRVRPLRPNQSSVAIAQPALVAPERGCEALLVGNVVPFKRR